MLAGRIAGDLLAISSGADLISGGFGAMGAGVIGCGTGVLCIVGAPAVAAGGGAVLLGGTLTVGGAMGLGQNLSLFSTKWGSKDNPDRSLRGFTPDERTHMRRIMSIDVDTYIQKHPKALTEPPGGPHVIETEQLIARLRTSISTLERSLPYLNDATKYEAEQAIVIGRSKLNILLNWFSR